MAKAKPNTTKKAATKKAATRKAAPKQAADKKPSAAKKAGAGKRAKAAAPPPPAAATGREAVWGSDDPPRVDPPLLGRWLGLRPAVRLAKLEARVIAAPEGEPGEAVVEEVRIALKQAWDEQPKVFFPLASEWLKSKHERLRRAAVGAVPLSHEEWKEKSERLLRRAIAEDEPAVRRLAIDLLSDDINGHLEQCKRWVRDEDPEVRALVARSLRDLATDKIKTHVKLIEPLLEDPVPAVHWTVASTLLSLYERDARPVIEVIQPMALSANEEVRAAAAACFFEHVFADHFDQLLPTMRAWLRTSSTNLRWTLVRALRFVKVTPRSMQLMRALFEDPEPEVRRRLVQAMLDLYDPTQEARRQLLPVLRRADQDPSKRVRDAVGEGKERFGELFTQELAVAPV
ncbi:MAG: HEAT repeat domain-containing protein [Planctomycetota bacterium]